MRVEKICDGEWEIYNDEKVVGRIDTFHGFRSNTKNLYVGEKKICEIKNQKEAIEKLEKFFNQNKSDIKFKEELIDQLSIGITQVQHQICIDVLNKGKEELINELKVLKSYDLI